MEAKSFWCRGDFGWDESQLTSSLREWIIDELNMEVEEEPITFIMVIGTKIMLCGRKRVHSGTSIIGNYHLENNNYDEFEEQLKEDMKQIISTDYSRDIAAHFTVYLNDDYLG